MTTGHLPDPSGLGGRRRPSRQGSDLGEKGSIGGFRLRDFQLQGLGAAVRVVVSFDPVVWPCDSLCSGFSLLHTSVIRRHRFSEELSVVITPGVFRKALPPVSSNKLTLERNGGQPIWGSKV